MIAYNLPRVNHKTNLMLQAVLTHCRLGTKSVRIRYFFEKRFVTQVTVVTDKTATKTLLLGFDTYILLHI